MIRLDDGVWRVSIKKEYVVGRVQLIVAHEQFIPPRMLLTGGKRSRPGHYKAGACHHGIDRCSPVVLIRIRYASFAYLLSISSRMNVRRALVSIALA